MSTAVTFNNPTKIIRLHGHNYIKFQIKAPHGASSGYYTSEDLDKLSSLHPQLKYIGRELLLMDNVEKFYINVGGDKPDRIVVKFVDHVVVTDGMLRVIADFIGERLG
jgi:hypothetical protein